MHEQASQESVADAGPLGISPADIQAALAMSRWHEAEARVYPLVMSDADLYEAAVEAVARLSRQVQQAYATREELLVEAGDDAPFPFAVDERLLALQARTGLSLRTLEDAARAQAYRLLPSVDRAGEPAPAGPPVSR